MRKMFTFFILGVMTLCYVFIVNKASDGATEDVAIAGLLLVINTFILTNHLRDGEDH